VKFSGRVGNGPMNKQLHFGGDTDHRLVTGTVFWQGWKNHDFFKIKKNQIF